MASSRRLDEPGAYQIVVEGTLDAQWASYWFEGFDVVALPEGRTQLTGTVADQSALYGLLSRIQDLGLPLLSLRRVCGQPS